MPICSPMSIYIHNYIILRSAMISKICKILYQPEKNRNNILLLTVPNIKNRLRSEVMHRSETLKAQNLLEKTPWHFYIQAAMLL